MKWTARRESGAMQLSPRWATRGVERVRPFLEDLLERDGRLRLVTDD